MEIRESQPGDAGRIREVARESLRESYGDVLDEETIDTVIEQWYATDEVEEMLSAEHAILLVAANDEMYGYAQGEILQGDAVIGDINWLHVRPEKRGEGFGVQLLGEIVDQMETAGASIVRGHVIEANEDGASFYEEHGFERRSKRSVDIGGQEYDEHVYEMHLAEDTEEEVLGTFEGPDGQELYIDYADGQTGVLAPLYPTYTDENRDEQYGWYCSNCGSGETTMDSAGRIQCANCENTRSATRWDGAYL